MDPLELKELTLKFKEAYISGQVEEFLQQNPKCILVIRYALGLSQKQFIRKLNKRISQVALIKHEKDRSKRINSKLIKDLVEILPRDINVSRVLRNQQKFESMKRGAHMTTERAKVLYKIWRGKIKKEQLQRWGRKGALKTNSRQKLTEQEKQIRNILSSMNLTYKIHYQTKTKIMNMNIDFVVFQKNKPKYFIEATQRKHDLQIICQAYAYRCRLLKERYRKAKIGIVIGDVPLSMKTILKNEFDFVINSDSLQSLSKFLQF